jgi:hypothetical protein
MSNSWLIVKLAIHNCFRCLVVVRYALDCRDGCIGSMRFADASQTTATS